MATDATPPTQAPPTHDEVMAALATVIDPELGADIVSLGMVPTVDIAPDGTVTVNVKLTIRGCPLRAEIKKEVEGKVSVHPGVTDVKITWGEMNADERCGGGPRTVPARVRLAQPTVRQRRRDEDAGTEPCCDLAGAVAGVVVDHQQFVAGAELVD